MSNDDPNEAMRQMFDAETEKACKSLFIQKVREFHKEAHQQGFAEPTIILTFARWSMVMTYGWIRSLGMDHGNAMNMLDTMKDIVNHVGPDVHDDLHPESGSEGGDK